MAVARIVRRCSVQALPCSCTAAYGLCLQGSGRMTDVSRRTLILTGGLFAFIPLAARAGSRAPTVLFICEFGTAKSAIARELFRRRARERGIAVAALSRGLKIEDHISPPLRLALEADRIDSRHDGFAIAGPKDVRAATIVVAFTPLPARYRPHSLQDWSAVPSVNESWPAARADLNRRIDTLLDAIEAHNRRRK
jgi:hypothetical protein